jgi:hypothetical protein
VIFVRFVVNNDFQHGAALLYLASNTLTHPAPDVSIRAAYQGATIA